MDRSWSQEDLLAFVDGRTVTGRSGLGDPHPLPGWLVSAADEEVTGEIEEFLASVHTEDRVAVIDVYGRSLGAPGEVLACTVRSTMFGGPAEVEITMLNLLDDERYGFLLVSLEPVGDAEEDDLEHDPFVYQRSTDWMILTADEAAVIVSVEGNTERFIGYRHDELVGRIPAQFVTADNLYAGIQMWRLMLREPDRTYTSRRQWVRKDGSTVWVETSYASRSDPPPGEGSIVMVIWDITDKMAAEEALRVREDELRRMAADFKALADEVPTAVFRCDAAGSVSFHNATWTRLLEGRPAVGRIHDLLAPEAARVLDATLARCVETRSTERLDLELWGVDGTIWKLGLRPLRDGHDTTFIGSLDDVTDTARLRQAASHDTLTGLLNRAATEAALTRRLQHHRDRTVVVFVDLDRFKWVKDTWGHEAGDQVLVEVAQRLAGVARAGDAVGRWGGDEFVLILDADTDADADQAGDLVIERLHQALDAPVELSSSTWRASASIGAARPRPGDSVDDVVARADAAMFAHKHATR